MSKPFSEDTTFEQIDFITKPPSATEYDYCRFTHCNFARVDLSNFRFVDCTFTDCDMSNAKLRNTTFNDCKFVNCKLLGLHFNDCSDFLFTVAFENCTLNFSSFYKRQMKKVVFKNTILKEVDFTDADLSGATFDNCDLEKALFENTNLEKADFRTAYNYSIDPEKARIKKARFSIPGITGLLDKYDIQIEVEMR